MSAINMAYIGAKVALSLACVTGEPKRFVGQLLVSNGKLYLQHCERGTIRLGDMRSGFSPRVVKGIAFSVLDYKGGVEHVVPIKYGVL